MAAASISLSQLISKNGLKKNIDIILPMTSADAIANMAVMFAGKTTINLNFSASVETFLSAVDTAEIKSIYTSRVFLQKLKKRNIYLADSLKNLNVFNMKNLVPRLNKPALAIKLLCLYTLPVSLLKYLFCMPVKLEDSAAVRVCQKKRY